MILALDTYYADQKAKTVGLAFENWTDPKCSTIYSEVREGVEDYVSGEFYKRELPCILSLLQTINLESVEVIIVDGYVYLNDDLKYGLGGHLYEKLENKIPIIGVAKNDFSTLNKYKRKVFRGKSKNPLYITAIGIDVDEAALSVQFMDGDYRIPTLLKLLDANTREL